RKEEAKEHWDTVRSEVKLQLARQHLDARRLDEAEKILQQTAPIAANNPEQYILVTRLRLEQGRLVEARDAIHAAMALPQKTAEMYYFSAIVAQRYGDLEEAAEHYAQAVHLAPNVADFVLAQAEVLMSLDRPIDAMELILSRAADFDSNAAVHMLAARIC